MDSMEGEQEEGGVDRNGQSVNKEPTLARRFANVDCVTASASRLFTPLTRIVGILCILHT